MPDLAELRRLERSTTPDERWRYAAAVVDALPALLDVAEAAHALIYAGGTARALSEALDRLEAQ